MNATYSAEYRLLENEGIVDEEDEDDDEDVPPPENVVIQMPEEADQCSQWNHLSDLDEFFTRIYNYVQRDGFLCMVLQDFFQLVTLWFIVIFPTFLLTSVNYDLLFKDKFNMTYRVIISDAVLPWNQIRLNFHPFLIIILIVTSFYLAFRTLKSLLNISQYWEMKCFFMHALAINSRELSDKTWREVQSKLMHVQKRLHMCINRQELTELDIYHRILRFKNYLVAMVNKSVLPVKFFVPFWGDKVFFTSGLKYNYEMVLFWGPGAPFESNWQLRSEYKLEQKANELAIILSRRIFIIGVINLILAPVISIWTILYFFFENFAIFRSDPGLLGSRRWSLYGRHFLRHFNELDHEFNIRLTRGHRAAEKYMNMFWSPSLAIVSHFVIVVCSGMLAFLVVCTIKDEDTLGVQGVIGTITILGIIVTGARSFIPNENLVRMPESLLKTILLQIHYINDSWKGQAHTPKVKNEFSQLFQYQVVYLLDEMISPLVTPFILMFWLRKRSRLVVDFLRQFTVSIEGVGDVCSFAQMNIKKHGHPDWTCHDKLDTGTASNLEMRAEHGKTELSLMHFTLMNPDWKVPETEGEFVNSVRHNMSMMRRDTTGPYSNPLLTSSQALSLPASQGFYSQMSRMLRSSEYNSRLFTPEASTTQQAPFDASVDARTQSTSQHPQSLALDSKCDTPYYSMAETRSRNSYLPLGIEEHWRTELENHDEAVNDEINFSALYLHDRHVHRVNELSHSRVLPDSGSVHNSHDLHLFSPLSPGPGANSFPVPNNRLSNIEEEEELIRQNRSEQL